MYIALPEFDCEIASAKEEMAEFAFFLQKKKGHYTRCIIISDHTIYPLYGDTIRNCLAQMDIPVHIHLLHPGESSKTLECAEACWKAMHTCGLDRHSLVIGLGGGVITDLSGFAASCYMRGIDVVHIPTTLLAMVDAAIGGKTGVNLASGKNLVGTFYHPKLVLINPNYLKTLPPREFRSGLAEVIKYGVIEDTTLFAFLEEHMPAILQGDYKAIDFMIAACCTIKAAFVRSDEKEQGRRAFLNYGHTFAHAIETATNYSEFLHGEAVAIGMNYAARTAQLLGIADETVLLRQKKLCQLAGLPLTMPASLAKETIIELMKGDKKAVSGKISLIVPEEIGKVIRIANIEEPIIREAIG